jgi:exopolysaccharide biosynthesis WecB/TagA/CpsF family protein
MLLNKKRLFLYKLLLNQKSNLTFDMLNNNGVYTFLNFYSIEIAKKIDVDYSKFNGIGLDGFLMTKLINILFKKKNVRLSFDFTSLATILFSKHNLNKSKIAIVGSSEEDINFFKKYIKTHYPGINIIYSRNGYFSDKTYQNKCIDQIISLEPDFILLGMGTEFQDLFALNIYSKYSHCQIFTCGGFIHQTKINQGKYYPYFINKYNLRWLYRLINEKKIINKIFPSIFYCFIYLFILRFKKQS